MPPPNAIGLQKNKEERLRLSSLVFLLKSRHIGHSNFLFLVIEIFSDQIVRLVEKQFRFFVVVVAVEIWTKYVDADFSNYLKNIMNILASTLKKIRAVIIVNNYYLFCSLDVWLESPSACMNKVLFDVTRKSSSKFDRVLKSTYFIF